MSLDLKNIIGKIYNFQLPRKIVFGINSSETVGLEAKALGGNKILLVTDNNLRRLNITEGIERNLLKEGLSVNIFSEVEAEPSIEVAEKVTEAARRENYDLVVGVGGGSVLDMAKVASIAITNPGAIRKYVGVNLVEKPGVPKILIPTTAGTGSEVTHVAVITLLEEEAKSAIISPHMFGDVAIVDPKLTYSMPKRLTASTGLDALSHALEALMAVNANPITDALALQSIKIIFENLPKAYEEGSVESRVGMSLGALIAGMAFINSWVCLAHALAYSFCVTYGIQHGLSCALSLPYAFKFNMPVIRHKIKLIADAIDANLKDKAKSPEELGALIFEKLLNLLEDLNAPKRLRDIGVPKSDLERIANKLLTFKRLLDKNPRPISKEDARKLILEMW